MRIRDQIYASVEQKLSIANKKKFMPNRTVLFHTFSEKVCRNLSICIHYVQRTSHKGTPHARIKVVMIQRDTLQVQKGRVQKLNACKKQLNGIEFTCMCREQVQKNNPYVQCTCV